MGLACERKVKFWQVNYHAVGNSGFLKRFRIIKPEIRILGIDDGPFEPRAGGEVPLVGVVFRGGRWLDGVLSTTIEQDGTNATERVVEMVNRSRHRGQLRIVMADGVTFAGFNVLDIKTVFKQTGLPVIVVSRERPNMADVRKAIKHLPDWCERWKVVKGSGKIYPVRTKRRAAPIYMQFVGMRRADAEQVVKLTSTRSLIPEPLRIAHLIATAMVRGESYGRA